MTQGKTQGDPEDERELRFRDLETMGLSGRYPVNVVRSWGNEDLVFEPGCFDTGKPVPLRWGIGGPIVGEATLKEDGSVDATLFYDKGEISGANLSGFSFGLNTDEDD
jgi:hypothetical protein